MCRIFFGNSLAGDGTLPSTASRTFGRLARERERKRLRQNPRWVAEVSVMEGGNGLINRPNEAQAIVCWGHGSGQLFNCRQEPELRVRVDLVGFPQGIVSIDEDHCRTVAGGHLLFSALSSWASD